MQAVLAARIDRLPPEEKRLLQTAAVIGTEVPLPLLQAIAELPEAALHRGLAHLQAAEFLYETRLFPEREYTFKHALTHEVAYGSLLQERRRVLHARIVEALEALAGDRVAEQVERLAHHALRGEVWDKALAYCRQAGEKAMARSAHREAVGYFEQALSALPHLPETARHARAGHRSPARPALGAPPVWRLWAYPGVSARGRGPRGGPRRPASAGTGLALSVTSISTSWARMTRPSPPPSAPSRSPRPAGMSSCTRWRTSTSASPTRPRATIVGRSTASGRPWRPSTGRGAASASVRSSCPPCSPVPASPGAMPSWARSPRAGPSGKKGSGLPRRLRTPASLMCASWGIGLLALRQGDLPRALPLLERAVGICQDADLPVYFPWMAAALGAAYTLAGRVADAVPLLTQAMEQTTGNGNGRLSGALSSLPGGGAAAGWPPGGGARPRRAGAGARP